MNFKLVDKYGFVFMVGSAKALSEQFDLHETDIYRAYIVGSLIEDRYSVKKLPKEHIYKYVDKVVYAKTEVKEPKDIIQSSGRTFRPKKE